MTKEFIFIIPLCALFINGTFTCSGPDWVLDGSKCLKTISGSPEDGQAQCSNEDSRAALLLAPTNIAAFNIAAKFPDENIWIGLRYQNGKEWLWDNGSTEPINWDSSPTVPQLCIGIFGLGHGSGYSGYMYDRFCDSQDKFICQTETNVSGLCESGWTLIGTRCYKGHSTGVVFSDARTVCSNENAMVIMPQSQSEAELIISTLNWNPIGWVGLTDFDADHIYTWDNGTTESQSKLYFNAYEPNKRDKDYICAYIQNDRFFNRECTLTERVVCEIAAINNSSTTVQTSTETDGTSADKTTTMQTSAITTTSLTVAEDSTSLDLTTAFDTPSTGSKIHTQNTEPVTTKRIFVGQSEKVTLMASSFQVSTEAVSKLNCIDKCTNHCSNYDNGTLGAGLNIPYKVDVKSLSSYRRRHQSAPDSRMSSFYIGCVGSVILVMTILLIMMLDFLPNK